MECVIDCITLWIKLSILTLSTLIDLIDPWYWEEEEVGDIAMWTKWSSIACGVTIRAIEKLGTTTNCATKDVIIRKVQAIYPTIYAIQWISYIVYYVTTRRLTNKK